MLFRIVAISTLILLSGCRESKSTDSVNPFQANKQREKVMRLAMNNSPSGLDPRLGRTRHSQLVSLMLFECLTQISSTGKPVLAAAKEVALSPDQKTYTFILRDEARWSNGEPVSAQDFEYAWKSILDPHSESHYAEIFYPIKNAKLAKEGIVPLDQVGIRASDPLTLIVELAYPAPYFLDLVAETSCAPVPHRIDQEAPNWNKRSETFVTNGPFHLSCWKHNEVIELEKSFTYWDQDSVKLPGISISIIEDNATALSLYEQGELDWVGAPFSELSLDALPKLEKEGLLKTSPILAVFQHTFDTKKPPFTSQKMRQAFACAINRKLICSEVLRSKGTPAGSLLPNSLALHDYPLQGDAQIDRARKLFQEGLDELRIAKKELPTITLSYSTIEGQKAMAQAIQQQWQEAFEIPIQIEGLEPSGFSADYYNRKLQTGGVSWHSAYNDPIFDLNRFLFCASRLNPTNWESTRYIELLDAANQETDSAKRRKLLAQAEAHIMDEAPVTPIYSAQHCYLQGDRLKGVVIEPTGYVNFKEAYFVAE